MAADSLKAHATAPEEKGRAGWSYAGNLGGSGLGGGAGMWLAQHVHAQWISGGSLGLVCILSAAAMFWLKEPPAGHRMTNYFASVANVGRECWEVVSTRMGFLALFIMLIPIGVGAERNLWSAVALVNGALGSVIAMFGCIAGGFLSDKMERKTAYCLFGIVLAVVAVVMALAPRTELMFVTFTCVYAFVLGLCYAAFGAVVLETVGAGAAATKDNVLAGISNAPIAYQTVIDGWGHDRWGASGLLYMEALCGVAAVGLYVIVAAVTQGPFSRDAPAASA